MMLAEYIVGKFIFMSVNNESQLYFLSDKKWKPLLEIIKCDDDTSIQNEIAIYQLYSDTSKGDYYAVVTASYKAGKIVEDYGGKLNIRKNNVIDRLRNQNRTPIYGSNDHAKYL
jgi:hypothetical protein